MPFRATDSESSGPAPSRVRAGADCGIFDDVASGSADLAIWHRHPIPGSSRLAGMPASRLPTFRVEGRIESIASGVGRHLKGRRWAWLAGDIAMLAARFATASGASDLIVRLEAISTDACRYLHHDYVPLRLVCTYRGPGTEWLPPAREDLIEGRKGGAAGLLESVPAFAPALFSGRTRPGAAPILHRSPPLGQSGIVRLVLTIDDARCRAAPAPRTCNNAALAANRGNRC